MSYLEQIQQHLEIQQLRSLSHEVGVTIYLADERVIVDTNYATEGQELWVDWDIDTMIRGAQRYGVTQVVMLHNHPPQPVDLEVRGRRLQKSIIAMFSSMDISGTREIAKQLRANGLQLVDSVMVTENITLSMRELGYIDEQGHFALKGLYPFWHQRQGRGSVFVWKKPLGYRLELREATVHVSGDCCYFSHGLEPLRGSEQWTLVPWSWAVWEWAITLNNVIPLYWRFRYWRELVRMGAEYVDTICDRHGLIPSDRGGYRVLEG